MSDSNTPITLSPEMSLALRTHLAYIERNLTGFAEVASTLDSTKAHYIKSKAARDMIDDAGRTFGTYAAHGIHHLNELSALISPMLSSETVTNVEPSTAGPRSDDGSEPNEDYALSV